jgi:hypothetical protein
VKKMSKRVIDDPVAPKYTHIERLDVKDFVCVRIDDGEFEGIVYHYENLQFGDEETEDDLALLNFNYHVVESFLAEEMMEGPLKNRFQDTIAAILYDILLQQVGRIGTDEDRADDSKESSSQ